MVHNRKMICFLIIAVLISISISEVTLPDTGVDSRPENVVYISIDALSAEHLQCYGYQRETAPNICGLNGSTVYRNAYATSYWTPVSLASMQRGVYAHKANLINQSTPMSSRYKSTADILREEGYKTFLVSNHASMSRELGFDQGFDRAELHGHPRNMSSVPGEMGEEADGKNLYFRMHITGSHDPYMPSWGLPMYEDYRFIEDVNRSISYLPRERKRSIMNGGKSNISSGEREEIINHYDENVRSADRYVGEFVEELKREGAYRDTLIIITADHGESFDDYGGDNWLHVYPNPSVARVPLIVKYPGDTERKEVSKLVSTMDAFKIILNEVGAETPSYELDAIDPREESREEHFTYVKRGSFAVTNKTHLAWSSDMESWNYFRKNGKFTRVDQEHTDLEEKATDFREKVFDREYYAGEPLDENMEEELRKLGYLK